eukprot:9498503-Alexandrium_andersonii.AAC.1
MRSAIVDAPVGGDRSGPNQPWLRSKALVGSAGSRQSWTPARWASASAECRPAPDKDRQRCNRP